MPAEIPPPEITSFLTTRELRTDPGELIERVVHRRQVVAIDASLPGEARNILAVVFPAHERPAEKAGTSGGTESIASNPAAFAP
jgi:hypothetical protein